VTGKDTWGKQAPWCDYSGPVDGKTLGVAIFDHPSNPRHPTWWHVRDYGLFAANPFGVHDFEKKPQGTGDLKVEAGKSITFKVQVLLCMKATKNRGKSPSITRNTRQKRLNKARPLIVRKKSIV
jgi:hypothetical protein